MPTQPTSNHELDTLSPAMSLRTLLIILVAVVVGVLGAVVVLPNWLPGLSTSVSGAEPKAFWYLSRASAMVAFGLVWCSMVFGLTMTNKLARVWPGGPTAFELHQHTSLLGLAFALFHGLILLGDKYINFTIAQIIVPFTSTGFKPIWVGLGQIGFYLLAIVGLSFYVRKRIGHRAWRTLHFLSFITFALALTHGILSGTDSGEAWAIGFYWASGTSLLFLTIYRILVAAFQLRDQSQLKRA